MKRDDLYLEGLDTAINSRDFQVITLTRPNGNEQPMLPTDILRLFENLKECLAPGCDLNIDLNHLILQILNAGKNETPSDIESYYKGVGAKFKDAATAEKLNEKLSTNPCTIKGELPKIDRTRYTILVFQETFFSKTHALDDNIVNLVVNCCKRLSNTNTKLIIVVNFLHEFKDTQRPDWLKGDIGQLPPIITGEIRPVKFSTKGDQRLANYSLIIYQGQPIAVYRKVFYAAEQNFLIEKGHVYEPGNFCIIPLIEDGLAAEAIAQCSLLRLFICADLNVSKEEHKKLCPTNEAKLSIVQSNTYSLSSSQFEKVPELKKLFSNRGLIIHADAKYGPFVGILKDGRILAYKPVAIHVEYQNPEIVLLEDEGDKRDSFPIFLQGVRAHTGMWGCSFGTFHCIINMWDLSKADLVNLFNYERDSKKDGGTCTLI